MPDGPAADIGMQAGPSGRSLFRNAAAQLVGRNFISLGRLLVASTIARTYGNERFGEYSLLIVMLAIAEWLLDFGTSDTFVREICQTPQRGEKLLRILSGLKALQVSVAAVGLVVFLAALQYPASVVQGGAVAALSLVFFGGVLIYHTLFKATLTIQKEVGAELLAVGAMFFLIKVVFPSGTLPMLMASHLASRAVFFGACYWWGRKQFQLSMAGITWQEIRWAFHSSSAIGAIGLVVVVYESVDILLLSRLGSMAQVAYYSGAQRFVAPVVIALSAIGATLYPVAAGHWPAEPREFARSCQRALEIVFVLAGIAVAGITASSEFLMSLIGPDLQAGAAVLQILALGLFVKAISCTLGAILYVVQAQNLALRMVLGALAVKGVLIALLLPRYGYLGVAVAAVMTDVATSVLTMFLLRSASGFQAYWSIPARVVAVTAVAVAVPHFVLAGHGWAGGLLALAIFLPLSVLAGVVKPGEMIQLVKERG